MINTDWPSGRKDAVLTVNGVTVADALRSVTYKDDLNGDSGAVMLGSAAAAQLVLVIDGPSVTYTDAKLTLSLGGVPLGVFHVTQSEKRDGLLTVTALDAMAGDAMLLTYTPGAASTALGVIREIADTVGLSFAATTGGETILTEAEAELTAENGDALVTDGIIDVAVTPPSGRTRREMLGLMAALLGRNAHIDRHGYLTLRWYADAACEVTPDDIYANGLAMEDSDFAIGRIECSVTTTTATAETDDDGNTTTAETTETTVLTAGSGTTGISLADDAMTQETLEAVYAEIGGMSFRPMQVTIYGDARIETGDLITVTDLQGAAHAVPVMAVTHTWDGGVKTTITAVGKPSETLGSAGGTLSKAVDNLALEFARFKNLEAENLRAQNAKFENVEAKKLVVLDADGNIAFRADASTHTVQMAAANIEGQLSSDQIKLYGLLTVYETSDLPAIGGHVGYGDSSTDIGDGIAMISRTPDDHWSEAPVLEGVSVIMAGEKCLFLGNNYWGAEEAPWHDGGVDVYEENFPEWVKLSSDGLTSNCPITAGGDITDGDGNVLSDMQPALTFDETPTSESTNPVTSGGVYDALHPSYDFSGFASWQDIFDALPDDSITVVGADTVPASLKPDSNTWGTVTMKKGAADNRYSVELVCLSNNTAKMYVGAPDGSNGVSWTQV